MGVGREPGQHSPRSDLLPGDRRCPALAGLAQFSLPFDAQLLSFVHLYVLQPEPLGREREANRGAGEERGGREGRREGGKEGGGERDGGSETKIPSWHFYHHI